MAITDIAAYAHLSPTDIEALGAELDAIRRDVEESRGAKDATYIRRAIAFQRALDVAARLLIAGSRSKTGWWSGTASLAYAKCIENMELGAQHLPRPMGLDERPGDPLHHLGVGHGRARRRSGGTRTTTATTCSAMCVGMDDDLGFGVMRVTRDQQWKPEHLLQPLRNVLLAATFEWGIALHDFYSERDRVETRREEVRRGQAAAQQDRPPDRPRTTCSLPALSGRRWRRTLGANVSANLLRNIWTNVVILCGHFPDGAEKFTAGRARRRDQQRVVSAADAGGRELRRRPAAGVLDWQPVLPDRAPPVPRPAEQPLPGDRRAGAGAVRQVRPALHQWLAARVSTS